MSLSIAIPNNPTQDARALAQCLADICRRAVDGTVPINLHVSLSVNGADISVLTPGKGVVVATPNGQHTYRLGVANTGAVTATKVT